VLTPGQVENHIIAIDEQIGDLIDDIAAAEERNADATYAYELAYHGEFTRLREFDPKLAVDKLKAQAEHVAIELRHEQLLADGLVRALRSKRDLLIARLTAAQTIGRFVAQEAGLAPRR
jgi:hypothetical protein